MIGTSWRTCAWCGLPYSRFRVGLRFAAVRRELGAGAARRDPDDRRYVTRHTVLGRMHEHKQALWTEHHGPGRCAPTTPVTTPEAPCPF